MTSCKEKLSMDELTKEFYKGCKQACGNNLQIVGGDITGSEKIYVSICAIGKTQGRNISSRKNAQIGQKVIVSGVHGSSGAGLSLLLNKKAEPEKFIKSHLEPQAQILFGQFLGENIKEKYASMDTSDGLMDALSTIANESGVMLEVDFDKIPYDKDIEQFENWKDMVLFGGEDYQIVATVPQNIDYGTQIGTVKEGLGVNLKFKSGFKLYTKQDVYNKIYNHFE